MNMEQWARVRRKILVDGRSKRSVMSEEGLHWESLQKMLSHLSGSFTSFDQPFAAGRPVA